MSGRFYIVWNEARNEAFLTDDYSDANSVVTGVPHYDHSYPSQSTIGEAFHEAYGDEGLSVEEIDL